MPDLLQSPRFRVQGVGIQNGVFDGIISATSPHLPTRWRAQKVYLGKAVTVSTFEGDHAMRYKSDNSGQDRDDYHPDPCDCWYF